MKNILVTGANGFIGTNLSVHLRQKGQYRILLFDIMNSIHDLNTFIEQADFIFHLAGVNRPEHENEFTKGNVELTEYIVHKLQESGKKLPVLMTSTTQASLDNPYGKSKRAAEKLLLKYAATGGKVYLYRLKNVFGKWCKPNYNSVVATFCYNIAKGEEIFISDPDKIMELVYIDDVIHEFVTLLGPVEKAKANKDFLDVHPFYQITLKDLAMKIYEFRAIRKTHFLPDFSDPFTQKLYATYISFLSDNKFSYHPKITQDERGMLFEFIKSEHSGQIFVSTTKPGITRGNHYHHTKNEKFCVICGEAVIKFRNVLKDEVIEYRVSGDKPEIVDIPPGFTHSITNTGNSDVITLFWASELFDSENPDTFIDPTEK